MFAFGVQRAVFDAREGEKSDAIGARAVKERCKFARRCARRHCVVDDEDAAATDLFAVNEMKGALQIFFTSGATERLLRLGLLPLFGDVQKRFARAAGELFGEKARLIIAAGAFRRSSARRRD